ncbi:MAG: carbamoyltransferase HypF [Polyangiaceae bacterium]
MKHVHVRVIGTVQGVGYRPFVHRAAVARGLAGTVCNDGRGVSIAVQGDDDAVDSFVVALRDEAPLAARVVDVVVRAGEVAALTDFHILQSVVSDSQTTPSLPPDRAPCAKCLGELGDPRDRRHAYPFTNCTDCGPRYTIALALPYDRSRTTLRGFPLCPACAREYADPLDRRFHAEPVACPACGPQLAWSLRSGEVQARGLAALGRARDAIFSGAIVAIKGVGGYQFACDATNERAVATLRERKRRPDKAFAVMFASLNDIARCAHVSEAEARALSSHAAPIVLLAARSGTGGASSLAASVARASPWIGAMTPSSPLHRLLMDQLGGPIVCTSGNVADEPICVDDAEALASLGGIADFFLLHNRPIARPVDDSVVRVGPLGVEVLRRARGYAPAPILLATGGPTVLALGAHLKSTISLAIGSEVVMSQHLGDLDTVASRALLERTVVDLLEFHRASPEVVACDRHPDYASTVIAERMASDLGIPIERVQHHHAHVGACLAEHGADGPVLGLAWDGAGLGEDGELWGGEAFVVDHALVRRVARLRSFCLPGGDSAAREPRRAALGILYSARGDAALPMHARPFTALEGRTLLSMLRTQTATQHTTSIGRLFDALASLAGVRDRTSFEGQAAMEFEALAEPVRRGYSFALHSRSGTRIADWEPVLDALLEDVRLGVPVGVISGRFHAALADLAVEIARAEECPRVALTGGCFQSRLLSFGLREALERAGFEVLSCAQVPPNDGGLSLGQVWIARERWKERQNVSRNSR